MIGYFILEILSKEDYSLIVIKKEISYNKEGNITSTEKEKDGLYFQMSYN